jgi:hypothetical protein
MEKEIAAARQSEPTGAYFARTSQELRFTREKSMSKTSRK